MPRLLRPGAPLGECGTARVRRESPLDVLTDALIAVLLAPRCAACDQPLDNPSQGPVCVTCWDSVRLLRPPVCAQCGEERTSWRAADSLETRCERCRRITRALDAGRGAADYDGALRRVIHAFKYEGRRSLASPLGAMLRRAGDEVLAGASCVIPVPLHPLRRATRGFNQARDLARTLPLPVVSALWRSRATKPQEHLTAAARRRNVRGAFRVSPLLLPRTRSRAIEGQVVVLIDDVRTTGATLEQCAFVLKGAGAREVRALTVAIAGPHQRPRKGIQSV